MAFQRFQVTHLISNLPFQCLRIDKLINLFHKRPEIKEIMGDFHLISLNPGHIQDIIDQGKKVFGRSINLLETVLYGSGIMKLDLSDGAHAYDGIHRSPDIVAHAGKKV